MSMGVDKKARSPPKPKAISELPYATLKRLADRLDMPCDGSLYWRKLISVMSGTPYDQLTVERFAMNAHRLDGSPAYALLTDMSNRGVSYDELITYLKKMNHYAALQELGYREEVRFTRHPEAAPAVIGQKFILDCEATGVPAPMYLWFKERTPLPENKSCQLVIEKVGKDDSGMYCCRATNDVNVVFSNWAEVKVQKPSILRNQAIPSSQQELPERPTILTQPPPEATLHPGQELHLVVVAHGPGNLTYQWFRDDQAMAYATLGELVLPRVALGDQGVYSCRVTSNFGGSILSDSCHVVVVNPEQAYLSPPPPPQHPLHHPNQPVGGYSVPQPEQHFRTEEQPHPVHQPFPLRAEEQPRPLHQPFPLRTDEQPHPLHQPFPLRTDEQPHPLHQPQHYQWLPMEDHRAHLPPGAAYEQQVGQAFSPVYSSSSMSTVNGHSQPYLNGSQALPPVLHSDAPVIKDLRRGSPPHLLPSPRADGDDGPCGQDEHPDLNDTCYDKVALLIGNKRYHQGQLMLNTPENDTQDLAGVLRSAGFKVVSLVNLTKQEMDQAMEYFATLIGKNVYALFFFAGHGFELNNLNYMMAVDASMDKNPLYCLCAQHVLHIMQSRGAKLSIVLLDMCRVRAPSPPLGQYEVLDIPPPRNGGYFLYGFSCSPAGRAYEAGTSASSNSLPPIDRENSIFVSALKEHFQKGTLGQRVDHLLSSAAEGVRIRGNKCCLSSNSWQQPEIRTNLGEPLTLWDHIKPLRASSLDKREDRAAQWQGAHCVPVPVVVSSPGGELALRLHFEAEHSNVLVVTAELLNGCLSRCEVHSMKMELLQDMHPHFPPLCSEEYGKDAAAHLSKLTYGHDMVSRKTDLIHFKIPDIQKIQSLTVTLRISATYRSLEERGEGPGPKHSCIITHTLPPPLYSKVLTYYQQETSPGGFQPLSHPFPYHPPSQLGQQ